ncbi:MAG TPA: hypothetical protein VH351_06490 [Bryobacteraceae bacterium]|nr:hypothetical protein [Bryobacteraceae bacterium]
MTVFPSGSPQSHVASLEHRKARPVGRYRSESSSTTLQLLYNGGARGFPVMYVVSPWRQGRRIGMLLKNALNDAPDIACFPGTIQLRIAFIDGLADYIGERDALFS